MPRLVGVNFFRYEFYLVPIPGFTLEQIRLNYKETFLKHERGKSDKPGQMIRALEAKFINQIRETLTKIHAAGVCMRDLHYANIIRNSENNMPVFIDFEVLKVFEKPFSVCFFIGEIKTGKDLMHYLGPKS